MKSITDYIPVSEAREITYHVAIIDVKDKEGIPPTIKMVCPAQFQKEFEKWLEDEQDNTFAHAEGGNVEY